MAVGVAIAKAVARVWLPFFIRMAESKALSPLMLAIFLGVVGAVYSPGKDFAVKTNQEEVVSNSEPLLTPPDLRAACRELLPQEDIKLRQRKLGELFGLAALFRPDICARPGRIAARFNSLRRSDVYRINDLARTAQEWQKAAVLKYATPSHPGAQSRGDTDGRRRARGAKIHYGTMSVVV